MISYYNLAGTHAGAQGASACRRCPKFGSGPLQAPWPRGWWFVGGQWALIAVRHGLMTLMVDKLWPQKTGIESPWKTDLISKAFQSNSFLVMNLHCMALQQPYNGTSMNKCIYDIHARVAAPHDRQTIARFPPDVSGAREHSSTNLSPSRQAWVKEDIPFC